MSVLQSNVRWGDIGSTFPKPGSGSGSSSSSTVSSTKTTSVSSSSSKSSSTTQSATKSSSTTIKTTTKPPPTTTSTKPAEPTQTHYGQCGGKDYKGPTKCASPYTCKKQNDYYSQCL